MFDFFRKKAAQPAPAIRDVLFGDVPLSDWPPSSHTPPHEEPWASFLKARECLGNGEREGAVRALNAVTAMPNLDSRQYSQAWHALKQLGVSPPPSEQKRVLGVVVEVGMKEGLDIVAAYEDRSARYFSFSGGAVIWERPDTSLDTPINMLLDAGKFVAVKIGPWPDPHPAAPPEGGVRISTLTPSGLHFGQGPFDVLASDPLAAPVITAAMELMRRLFEKTEQR